MAFAPPHATRRRPGGRRFAQLLLALALGGGCAAGIPLPTAWDYFAAPQPEDPWMRKIAQWQERERWDLGGATTPAPAQVAGSGAGAEEHGPSPRDLRGEYDAFRGAQRRSLARDLATWIQRESVDHYIADGPVDRWATLAETLDANGDDCDGLELLVYRMLREFGFGQDEVYRAIVVRPADGQHHMVTLWFEDKNDPWVIDPTGAMVTGMPRMSEVPGWRPLKVFGLENRYTVEPLPVAQVSK